MNIISQHGKKWWLSVISPHLGFLVVDGVVFLQCFLPSQAQLTFIALTCCMLSCILLYNFVSGSWRGDLVPRWHKGLLEILLDPGSVWGLVGSGWVLREQSLVLTSTDRAGLYIWPVEEQTDQKAETFNILICFGVLLSHVAAHLSLRKHPISLVSLSLPGGVLG